MTFLVTQRAVLVVACLIRHDDGRLDSRADGVHAKTPWREVEDTVAITSTRALGGASSTDVWANAQGRPAGGRPTRGRSIHA